MMYKILLTILLPLTLLSNAFADINCPKSAKLRKIVGIKTKILEKPKDKHQIDLGNQTTTLIVNSKNQLVIDNKGTQQVVTDLIREDKLGYYIEIASAGDDNGDCIADLLIWKKSGAYIGHYRPKSDTHEASYSEKIYIESQVKKKPTYIIKSLGQY